MSAVPTRIAGIAIPDNALAREATEFVSDASTRCCSTIHDECSSGRRCGPNGTFIAAAGVTSSEASPRLTLVGGPDEVEATEARVALEQHTESGPHRRLTVGDQAPGSRTAPVVLIDAMLPGLSCVEATAVMSAESGPM
jgi:hypothetical protein